MLFNIFINDLTEIFDEKCCPVMIVACRLFATVIRNRKWIEGMYCTTWSLCKRYGNCLSI